MREGLGDQVLVRAHALDVGRSRLGVDRDDARQARRVEARPVRRTSGTEEVRGPLGQAQGAAWLDGGGGADQRGHGFGVLVLTTDGNVRGG
ncbi:hypothetical protein D3C74_376640 [compost metagenome]